MESLIFNFIQPCSIEYKNLEIWKLSREIVIEIHEMTLKLPKFEMFEEGQQTRRSSKSVKATIVEGYGRRIYKQEFLKYLVYAIGSNDETRDHLENLYETKSLTNESVYKSKLNKIDELGRKLHNFYKAVEAQHKPVL